MLTAFYARATGDSTFNTAIGGSAVVAGRLYASIAPQNATLPYAVYVTQGTGRPLEGYGFTIHELPIRVLLVGDQVADPATVLDLLDKLKARMDWCALTVTGGSHVFCRPDGGGFGPERDSDRMWCAADYTIAAQFA